MQTLQTEPLAWSLGDLGAVPRSDTSRPERRETSLLSRGNSAARSQEISVAEERGRNQPFLPATDVRNQEKKNAPRETRMLMWLPPYGGELRAQVGVFFI